MAVSTAAEGRERVSSSAASWGTGYYSPMLTLEELEALTARIAEDSDLARLLGTLRSRSARLLLEMPPVPRVKAFLSRDGGVCPVDGAPLAFDPWSPDRHTCTRCGQGFTSERHHSHWARAQHLWLAERTAELALISVVADDAPAGARAIELLAVYEDLYFALPNRDNVLGPSHLFFSTYLESLWLTSWLGAAFILREAGRLSDERVEGVNRVADEAARIIGDFNEGLSNRQTWHAAALTAIAAWFGDPELARTAVEERTGLLGHLADGFGEDGLWWEGENYHLFALRGVMLGLHWARAAGYHLLEDEEITRHFREALLAPTRSALPDFTYPARRDSRYGVSLAEAPSLELWEVGRGWLGRDAELDSWLGALYALESPTTNPLLYDAWLHDAGRTGRQPHQRDALSWWALTAMGQAPGPAQVVPWRPQSVLLAGQGLAVLRQGNLYASLECGREIGGHGHPDWLHLTLHAGGAHWLPDPGTGSYVEPLLEWYRSSLAHNAPRRGGLNSGGEDAWCEAFESGGDWAWCRARAGNFRRTLVAGPGVLLDVLDIAQEAEGIVDLPWHFLGSMEVISDGAWEPAALESPFVSHPERFIAVADQPIDVRVRHPDSEATLWAVHWIPGGELLRAMAPGLPGTGERKPFWMVVANGRPVRWITALGLAPLAADPTPRLRITADQIEVTSSTGVTRYHLTETSATIERGEARIALSGLRPEPPRHRPIFQPRDHAVEAFAPFVHAPPALDGTMAGFDTGAPLDLDSEHQYRRSEEPYDPETFSARAWVNWDGEALYLAVAVSKPSMIFRPADAPSSELDNEPEDINSDGLQIYLGVDGPPQAVLVTPAESGGLFTRQLGAGDDGQILVHGAWQPTELGYVVTLRLGHQRLAGHHAGARLGFDLLINDMQPGRLRRAGQLVWTGGGGWIYLRGDRHDLSQLGALELR